MARMVKTVVRRKVNRTKRAAGFGHKDGSQRRLKSGGLGRNRTSVCRHPSILQGRK